MFRDKQSLNFEEKKKSTNTSRHKYLDETKVKYTHNLNLLHVHFGILLNDTRLFSTHLAVFENYDEILLFKLIS